MSPTTAKALKSIAIAAFLVSVILVGSVGYVTLVSVNSGLVGQSTISHVDKPLSQSLWMAAGSFLSFAAGTGLYYWSRLSEEAEKKYNPLILALAIAVVLVILFPDGIESFSLHRYPYAVVVFVIAMGLSIIPGRVRHAEESDNTYGGAPREQ